MPARQGDTGTIGSESEEPTLAEPPAYATEDVGVQQGVYDQEADQASRERPSDGS